MDVVVAGYDGSETAAIAVGEGARIAHAMGATLHLVQVIDDGGLRQGVVNADEQATRESIAAAQNAEIATTLDSASVVTEVLRGPVASRLNEYAESIGADLIVLGNRRVKGLARVLGSVTLDVLRQAPCSVYVANTTS